MNQPYSVKPRRVLTQGSAVISEIDNMYQLDGLTQEQVNALTLEGKSNAYDAGSSRSVWDIVRDNTFNLFIMLNVIIAACLLFVEAYTNAMFIVLVAIGVIGGIVIEIRARNMVHKLTLLNVSKAEVIRGGEAQRIHPDEIVLGDLLRLRTGDQIPADAVVRQGSVEVNEALLTGEADLIVKESGGKLLSGSFVASGSCLAEVEHVGADNYITKLTLEAKTHKQIKSEILDSIKTVAKFTSRVIVPLGLILLLEALLIKHDPLKEAVMTTSAALLGMLPKGLAVLTIVALISAVFKLGRKKVLVQEIYSVETMAHVDTLCLDKTGTLTEGKMRVHSFELLSDKYSTERVAELIGSYVKHSADNNTTMLALRAYFAENDRYEVGQSIAFSPNRKWGSMFFQGVGTVVLGAPERVFTVLPQECLELQRKGFRVLGLGVAEKKGLSEQLTGVTPVAMIVLEDSIRKDAKKTLRYLRGQDVDLKIISGDHPLTVSKVAQRAGFENYEDYLDVSGMSDEDLRAAVLDTAIFGRVSPWQKKLIVTELKKAGRTVAMTGDGVNDILALREADLSIVMAEGDSATKQISNIVLLDSNFSELPNVLFEGRRVVNNMFRVASIFFIKTIYSFFISVLCAASVVTGSVIVFPLTSLQILALDQFLEGYPSLFMSFEEDKTKFAGKFLKVSLLKALPQSLMVTAGLVVIYCCAQAQGWGPTETSTLMYYVLGTVMLIGLFKAFVPFSKLRVFLWVTSAAAFYLSAYIFGRWFGDVFDIGLLNRRTFGIYLIFALGCVLARILIDLVGRVLAQARRADYAR